MLPGGEWILERLLEMERENFSAKETIVETPCSCPGQRRREKPHAGVGD
jgi:hypothetical protein